MYKLVTFLKQTLWRNMYHLHSFRFFEIKREAEKGFSGFVGLSINTAQNVYLVSP